MTHRFRAYLSFPHIIMNELSLCSGILIDFSIPSAKQLLVLFLRKKCLLFDASIHSCIGFWLVIIYSSLYSKCWMDGRTKNKYAQTMTHKKKIMATMTTTPTLTPTHRNRHKIIK